MKIEEKNFKTYSMIGSRATFGLVVLELAKKNKNIIAISADTSTSAGLDRLKKQLPNNFLDVGISEQNLIGIATGLSSEGSDVFTMNNSISEFMRPSSFPNSEKNGAFGSDCEIFHIINSY